MNTITLMDRSTGETVTFRTQTEAAKHVGCSVMGISRLKRGAVHSVGEGRFYLHGGIIDKFPLHRQRLEKAYPFETRW